MPSTHRSLNFHVIFSTYNRVPEIATAWRADLHAYLGGCIKGVGGEALAVGGIADHVHLLMRLRATHCLADVLRDVKAGSSRWVHECHGQRAFAWQDGYAGLSVSPSRIAAVYSYIKRQEEHHRKQTFQEEYLKFLQESGISYDERYLWQQVRTGLAPLPRRNIFLSISGGSGPPNPGGPPPPAMTRIPLRGGKMQRLQPPG